MGTNERRDDQAESRAGPQNLGAILSISGILAPMAPFVGGAWGARTGRERP